MKERHLYSKAYNHHCGNWGSLLKLLNSLTESAVVLGDALEKIATANMGLCRFNVSLSLSLSLPLSLLGKELLVFAAHRRNELACPPSCT